MKFIHKTEVLERTGLSDTELRRREAAGTFPRRITLGPQTIVWKDDEVLEWQEEQVRIRDAQIAAQAEDQESAALRHAAA